MKNLFRWFGLVTISFALSGCSLPFMGNPTPYKELWVYGGDCHIVGNDVYFNYNGYEYLAKGQKTNYQKAVKKVNTDTGQFPIIENQDGSFFIPSD